MKEKLDELLKYDSLAEAEKITGKHSQESLSTVWLGIGLLQKNTKAKNAILDQTDDTFLTNTIEDYIRKLTDYGFEQVYTENFQTKSSFDEDYRNEECRILFYPKYSILLFFDTYKGNVNSSSFYYNWKPFNDEYYGKQVTSSGGFTENKIWVGGHDGREAVKRKIERLAEYGAFLTQWEKCAFNWLATSKDFKKTSEWDFEKSREFYIEVTKKRLANLPENVLQAIGRYEK